MRTGPTLLFTLGWAALSVAPASAGSAFQVRVPNLCAGTTVTTVSHGLGVTPKALITFMMGATAAVPTSRSDHDDSQWIGFYDGTSSKNAGTSEDNAQTTTNGGCGLEGTDAASPRFDGVYNISSWSSSNVVVTGSSSSGGRWPTCC